MIPYTRSRTAWTAALVAVALATAAPPVFAQATGSIRGKVTDAVTARPLGGAQVYIPGTNRGTLTTATGDFLVLNVPVGTVTLRVEMLGYGAQEQTVTVSTGDAARADFALSQAVIALDEVVVTGTPGATQKRTLGNTVSTIQAAEVVEEAPISTVDQLLVGRTPGLTLMAGAGTVGTGGNIRIRGAGSLEAGNRPVFYVDGVRIQSSLDGEFSVSGQSSNPLDHINPEDIESVEVIKGPAASTLYGAEAASGVIQIITKKGRIGQQGLQWTAKVERGQTDWALEHPKNYKVCTPTMIGSPTWPGCDGMDPNAPEIDRLLIDSPLDRNGKCPTWNTGIECQDGPPALRTGVSESYGLSVRGGGDRFSFYAAGDHDYESGVFYNNYFKRTTGRINFQVTPFDNLDGSVSLGYNRSDVQLPLNDNASNGLLRNAYRGEPGRYVASQWAPGWLGLSPEQINQWDNRRADERFIIGTTLNYKPAPWFTNKLTLGLDKNSRTGQEFTPIDTTGRAPFGNTRANGQIARLPSENHQWTVDYAGTINYQVNDDLTSTTSAGLQYNARRYHSYTVTGEGLVADKLNLIGGAAVTRASEFRSEQNSVGMFVQEQIGWRDRVFVTGAVRFDDNSAFGQNFTWAVYPKMQASWVVSEEPFFNLPAVDNMKLRFAWGKAGNAPAPFEADQTFAATRVTLDDGTSVNAITSDAYGNPDLTAESGQELEVGFDASLFENRLGLEATYYTQQTKNALISLPAPPSSGWSGNQLRNLGEIANSGFEFSVFGSPIYSRNLVWDVRATLSTNGNEVVDLGRDDPVVFGSFQSVQQHREGYPLAGYWAWDVVRDASGNPVLDGNGAATASADTVYVGNSAPTRELSLTNTFTILGNLRLYVFADYKGGHYMWSAREWWRSFNQDISYWVSPLNGDATTRAVYRSGATRAFIDNADFIKLREVSLTYTLPSSWSQAFRARSASFTISGRNLAVWSKYDLGSDPELNFSGNATFSRTDYMSTPMLRKVVAFMSVNF